MEENETSNPVHVRLLGPVRVVEGANSVTDLVEETDSACGWGRFDVRTGWTYRSGGATIRGSQVRSPGLVHAKIFRPPMQRVTPPLGGVRKGVLERYEAVVSVGQRLRNRLHSGASPVQSI
jgi:hypothetical protein